MKIAISIEHPAWAHQFRWLIKTLKSRGHEVLVLAIDKDKSFTLLERFGIPYTFIAPHTGIGIIQKGWLFFLTTWRMWRHCRRFRPDVFIGRASPMLAFVSFLFGRPHYLFEDTERAKFSLTFCKLFSTVIITSHTFTADLGPKQRRVNTFKELFYLHPDVYTPGDAVVRRLGLKPGGYIFVRFVAWNASHDFAMKGLSGQGRLELVRELSKLAPVVVSCEGPVSEELRRHMPEFDITEAHDLLANAALYVGESGTMASESVVLGVHAVHLNPQLFGYLAEQKRLGLLYSLPGPDRYEKVLPLVRDLMRDPDLVAKGREKRKALLSAFRCINQDFLSLVESGSPSKAT